MKGDDDADQLVHAAAEILRPLVKRLLVANADEMPYAPQTAVSKTKITRLALKEYLRTMDTRKPVTPDRAVTMEISQALIASALRRDAEAAARPSSPQVDLASEPGRLEILMDARTAAHRARSDVLLVRI